MQKPVNRPIDWEDLYKRVYLAAQGLLRAHPVDGLSPEDLAQETWVRFLEKDGLSRWDPASPLHSFVFGFMVNVLKEHRRGSKRNRVVGSLDDPNWETSEKASSTQPDLRLQMEWRSFLRAILKRGQADLEDVVRAADAVKGRGTVNKDIAKVTGRSAPEIRNIRKRLIRLAEKLS